MTTNERSPSASGIADTRRITQIGATFSRADKMLEVFFNNWFHGTVVALFKKSKEKEDTKPYLFLRFLPNNKLIAAWIFLALG